MHPMKMLTVSISDRESICAAELKAVPAEVLAALKIAPSDNVYAYATPKINLKFVSLAELLIALELVNSDNIELVLGTFKSTSFYVKFCEGNASSHAFGIALQHFVTIRFESIPPDILVFCDSEPGWHAPAKLFEQRNNPANSSHLAVFKQYMHLNVTNQNLSNLVDCTKHVYLLGSLAKVRAGSPANGVLLNHLTAGNRNVGRAISSNQQMCELFTTADLSWSPMVLMDFNVRSQLFDRGILKKPHVLTVRTPEFAQYLKDVVHSYHSALGDHIFFSFFNPYLQSVTLQHLSLWIRIFECGSTRP